MSLKFKVRSQLLEEQAREVAASGAGGPGRGRSLGQRGGVGRVGYLRMIAVWLAESGDSKGSEFV